MKRRLERFLERHGLGGDHVLQRTALRSGEDCLVDHLGVHGLAENHPTARATQGFVRGGGDHVGMRDG